MDDMVPTVDAFVPLLDAAEATSYVEGHLLSAAEAYESERFLWSVRTNKAWPRTRYEVVRTEVEPKVMAWSTDRETAIEMMATLRGGGAMKVALDRIGR
jgi:hypothetical protein